MSSKTIYFRFSRFSTLLEKKKAELLKIAKKLKIKTKKPTNAELIIAILLSESSKVKGNASEYYTMEKKKMLNILKKNKKEVIDDLQKKKKHKGLKSSDKKKKLVELLVTYESVVTGEPEEKPESNEEPAPAAPKKGKKIPCGLPKWITERSKFTTLLKRTPDHVRDLITNYHALGKKELEKVPPKQAPKQAPKKAPPSCGLPKWITERSKFTTLLKRTPDHVRDLITNYHALEKKELEKAPAPPKKAAPEPVLAGALPRGINNRSKFSTILKKTPGPVRGLITNYLNQLIDEDEKELRELYERYKILFYIFQNAVDAVLCNLDFSFGEDYDAYMKKYKSQGYIETDDIDWDFMLRPHLDEDDPKIEFMFPETHHLLDDCEWSDWRNCLDMANNLPKRIPLSGMTEELFDSMWKKYEKKYYSKLRNI